MSSQPPPTRRRRVYPQELTPQEKLQRLMREIVQQPPTLPPLQTEVAQWLKIFSALKRKMQENMFELTLQFDQDMTRTEFEVHQCLVNNFMSFYGWKVVNNENSRVVYKREPLRPETVRFMTLAGMIPDLQGQGEEEAEAEDE